MNDLDVVDFERELYRELCEEMRELLSKKKELAAREEEIRKRLLAMSGGARMEHGIQISLIESRGSVDYRAMVEGVYTPEEVERLSGVFRKPDKSYWKITSY